MRKGSSVPIMAIVFAVIGLALACWMFFSTNNNIAEQNNTNSSGNQNTNLVSNANTALNANIATSTNTDANTNVQTPHSSTGIYFAKGMDGKYSVVDVQTGATQDFIPSGYTIVDQHSYDPLPRFLILKKDRNLFSYEIENKLVNPIFTINSLLLGANEGARVYPSITDKNIFFLILDTYDPNEEPGMGTPTSIGARSYIFNASTNELQRTDNLAFTCGKYDSKNQRFFSWRCGEGIGSVIPLSIVDLHGKQQKEVLSLAEFNLTSDSDSYIGLKYNNGLFFAISSSTASGSAVIKIVTVDPNPTEPTKETYTTTKAAKAESIDLSLYSITFVKSNNTFVFGGSSLLTLLRTSGNQIIESKTFPEQGLYANFIFPEKDQLYYQSRNAKAIRELDLATWLITKTLPIDTNEEITLVGIPK